MKTFARAALTVLTALVMCGVAHAEDAWPNRPIRIIVPYAPGGGGDNSVRLISDALGQRLGVSIIVDNRPGGTGYLGGAAVANAAPDGYTLLLGFDGSLVVAPLMLKAPFDPLRDFAPITKLNDAPLVLAAHPSVPARTLAELTRYSQTKGAGGLDFGSSGAGSTTHLAGELLAMRTGMKLTHVPYKGGGQAVVDVVAGQIPLIVTVVPTIQGYFKDGKLVPIGVMTAERMPSLPDTPTFMEQGVKDFDVSAWFGILAPAKTPRPVIDRLQKEIAAVLAMPEIRERYLKAGLLPVGNSPQAFGDQMKADYARWGQVVKDANIKLE